MIAITGATGLIGTHLTYALLKKGERVLALTTKVENTEKIKAVFGYYNERFEDYAHLIKFEVCDVLDVWQLELFFKDVKAVYHCAALVSFIKKDRDRLLKINGEGTANVVNAAMACGVEKFCYVSSVATLNNPDFTNQINEDIVWKSSPQQSQYAISKYMAEREVWRGFEEGLKGCIINPSIVLGPIATHQSSAQIILQAKKRMRYFTNGANGFVDVRDVAQMAIALMEQAQFKQRFILNGFNSSYETLFAALNTVFNNPAPSMAIPKWVLKMVAPISRLLHPMIKQIPYITSEQVNAAYADISFCNAKINRVLGIPFRSIDETVKWLSKA
jgi:dihydroflavonol-4-reductase